MKQENFEKYFKEIIMHASQLMMAKNGEYSPGEDKIANFRAASNFTGKPTKEIAFMYMMKHWDSIKTMCLSDKDYPAELWKEKLSDNIVYSAILYAILFDGATEAVESVEKGGDINEDSKK